MKFGDALAQVAFYAVDNRCQELADSPYDSQKVGSGVPLWQINTSEALPVCQQAATRQPLRPRYQYLYGRVLDVASRYAEAAQQYSLAKQGGYALAAVDLGNLYEEGLGVSQDFEQAEKLYREAAKEGVSTAFFGLGRLYDEGRGVPKDWGKAASWYQKAGDAGDAGAYAALSWHYAEESAPPNYAEAVKWAQKAIQGWVARWFYSTGLALPGWKWR